MEKMLSYWEYEWKKSKAKLAEVNAVDTFRDLPGPEWVNHGEYVYVIDEKQLYRAKHTERFKQIS